MRNGVVEGGDEMKREMRDWQMGSSFAEEFDVIVRSTQGLNVVWSEMSELREV